MSDTSSFVIDWGMLEKLFDKYGARETMLSLKLYELLVEKAFKELQQTIDQAKPERIEVVGLDQIFRTRYAIAVHPISHAILEFLESNSKQGKEVSVVVNPDSGLPRYFVSHIAKFSKPAASEHGKASL